MLLAGTLSALWLVAWAGMLGDLVARLTHDGNAVADNADAVADNVEAVGLVPVLLLAAAMVAVAIPLPQRCGVDAA